MKLHIVCTKFGMVNWTVKVFFVSMNNTKNSDIAWHGQSRFKVDIVCLFQSWNYYCVVSENIHTHLKRFIGNSKVRVASKCLKECMNQNCSYHSGGRRYLNQKLLHIIWQGNGYFLTDLPESLGSSWKYRYSLQERLAIVLLVIDSYYLLLYVLMEFERKGRNLMKWHCFRK